ncbi:MAG: ABC transporter ATP-binding protein [Aestuariivirga sp.]|uniref:ABC transporter ATP-binding protein n=1 Tax=Aestuariivirga sp. TaxID=2650926 RepID=UPI0025BDBBB6|nr:ABC transporter ATP-binding protein [Aestuariivirga sp.]MCA3560840.1 ABC transporter ATP-binding protein [Aestuariivirga sp.]
MSEHALLRVEGLTVGFNTEQGPVRVTEDVSFELKPGHTLGLVGESGCGKSVTAQTIMRLLPSPPSRIDAGRILFEGKDLATASQREMQKIRGDRIGMVFQEPMTSLNPTLRIGEQIAEPLMLHRGMKRAQADEEVIKVLKQVGIGNAERRLLQYPHELSGGLRQRVMIAIAIICKPQLLIADEPTTALDVTIQAQIMELLKTLQKDLGLAVLLITHDLGMVAEMCETIAVMYAGRIVEAGRTVNVFAKPHHPYTYGLLNSSPRRAKKGQRLPSIPGLVPPPDARGGGCSFAARCSNALERCRTETPPLVPQGNDAAACWNPIP